MIPNESETWTFFYGSYLNLKVLEAVDYVPRRFEVARLWGWDIRIRPIANLVPSASTCVYGIVATGTHQELLRLYDHAENVLGGRYLPEAVLVDTLDGRWRPALCYIAPELEEGPAEQAYVEKILQGGRQHGFPEQYLERLAAFVES